jgi:hypothetical protein
LDDSTKGGKLLEYFEFFVEKISVEILILPKARGNLGGKAQKNTGSLLFRLDR